MRIVCGPPAWLLSTPSSLGDIDALWLDTRLPGRSPHFPSTVAPEMGADEILPLCCFHTCPQWRENAFLFSLLNARVVLSHLNYKEEGDKPSVVQRANKMLPALLLPPHPHPSRHFWSPSHTVVKGILTHTPLSLPGCLE